MAPPIRARGVDLQVAYLLEGPGLHEQFRAAGVPLHEFTEGGFPSRVRRLTSLIDSLRPDLVHTSLFRANVSGRLAGAARGVPVVTSLTGEWYGRAQLGDPSRRPWKVRTAQALDVATARLTRRFHAVSAHVAHVMARRLLLDRRRIDVIPRGRDVGVLGEPTPERRRRARAELGVGDGIPVLLAAARHDHQKGLDVLLESLPAVLLQQPRARLFLAGREGSQTPLLRSAVQRLRLEDRVVFLGERDDVGALLCAADALVVPSRAEGFPGALLEAMALGTPIVATDIPATREVGGGEIGDLVPVGDSVRLARRLVEILSTRDGARASTIRARQRFLQRFTIDGIADQMITFYRRALGIDRQMRRLREEASPAGYGL